MRLRSDAVSLSSSSRSPTRAEERTLERVLVAAVVANLEVRANPRLLIGVDLAIEVVPNTADDLGT